MQRCHAILRAFVSVFRVALGFFRASAAGFLVLVAAGFLVLAAFAPFFGWRWLSPAFCGRFSRFGYGRFSRFGHGFNRSRQFRLGRFRSAMVAMVQRLDARSFFFRPQLSVCTVSALVLEVFRNRFSCHGRSVAELSSSELSNFGHSVTIHEPPRDDWTEMYYPTAIDSSPAVLAPLPDQIRNGVVVMLGKRWRKMTPRSFATFANERGVGWLVIAVQMALLIPIGLGAVIRVDFGTPGVVGHVRPTILVKTGSGLEQLLIDVQNELMFNRVDRKGTPWNGK